MNSLLKELGKRFSKTMWHLEEIAYDKGYEIKIILKPRILPKGLECSRENITKVKDSI